MRLETRWGNWQIFLVSIVVVLILTPLVEPYYREIFRYGGGGWLFTEEFDTYPTTFMFLYTFFLSFFYSGLSKRVDFLVLFYFLIVPLFFFAASPIDRVVTGFILLVVGLVLGKVIQKFAFKL